MTHGPAHGNLVTSNIGYWVLGIGYYDLVSWYPGIPVSWLPGYLVTWLPASWWFGSSVL